MSLLDPAERSERGQSLWREVTGQDIAPPTTLWGESWRDFVFAEVWSRPGLDRRARYLVSIAGAANVGSEHGVNVYVHGALKSGVLSLAEMREIALHCSVYGGWTRGGAIDAAASKAADALGLAFAGTPPLCPAPWDPDARRDAGMAEFVAVMTFPGGPSASPFMEAINNFVFGEMWGRYDGLDQRSRRWLTLVGVCDSAAEVPIRSHVHAAMASGNCTAIEMQEFVLQYGIHAGWPRASRIQSVVFEMIRKVADGLPYDG